MTVGACVIAVPLTLLLQALDKRDSLNICADPSSSTMTFMDDSMGNADNHGWEVSDVQGMDSSSRAEDVAALCSEAGETRRAQHNN